jgi:hypothetical protein
LVADARLNPSYDLHVNSDIFDRVAPLALLPVLYYPRFSARFRRSGNPFFTTTV